ILTCSSSPRVNSEAIRSPSDSIAALMALTRSSSTPGGSSEAMLSPSTLTMAAASTSPELDCKSRSLSINISVLDLDTGQLLIQQYESHGMSLTGLVPQLYPLIVHDS